MSDYIATLRRLAEQATPGPWDVAGGDPHKGEWGVNGPAFNFTCGNCGFPLLGLHQLTVGSPEDAGFIAALHPGTALKLLDVAEAAADAKRVLGDVQVYFARRGWEGWQRKCHNAIAPLDATLAALEEEDEDDSA